jgi:hypothetical protein
MGGGKKQECRPALCGRQLKAITSEMVIGAGHFSDGHPKLSEAADALGLCTFVPHAAPPL